MDEAYNELTADPAASTMIPLVKEGKNVAVARTFEDIWPRRYACWLHDCETGTFGEGEAIWFGYYGLNQAGVAAAVASYNDNEFLEYSKAKIVEAREMVAEALKQNALTALPSATNFMFVNLGDKNAESFRSGHG